MNPSLSLSGTQESVWAAATSSIGLATMEPASDTNKGYRPKQWSPGNVEVAPLYFIKLTDSNNVDHYYYFDATLKAEHNSSRRITEHPVQTGADITDHSYQLPSVVSLEIGVSDSMDIFDSTNNWSQFDTVKTVNAFKTMLTIQKSGLPLIVQTRLNTYESMLIESINTKEDNKTRNVWRATVNFREVILVTGSTTKVNSKEDFTTGSNQLGAVNTPNVTYNNEGVITSQTNGLTFLNLVGGLLKY